MDSNTWIYICLLSWISFVSGDEAYRCPAKDIRSTTAIVPFNERCYHFINHEKYWTSASSYCRQYGGRLVTINDRETNEFIVRTLNRLPWTNKGVWIGLHDRDKELRWQWSTESDYVDEPMRFANWARGHPKAFLHSMRDCVRMTRKTGWRWHETPCSALKWKYRFICEYGMLPPSTSTAAPTYPPGFHEPLHQFDWGQSRAARPDGADAIITVDDVSTKTTPIAFTKSPHKSKTTTKPEFYEEDSINVIVPMQLTQDRSEEDGRGNVIFGVVGCIVGLLVILAFVLVIFVRRRKQKEASPDSAVEDYGSLDGKAPEPSKVQNEYVIDTGTRVMNIYTNPTEKLEDLEQTALQRLRGSRECLHLVASEDLPPKDLEDENVKNQQIEDASQYLEPQVCMAHRPLPEVTDKVMTPEVEVKPKRTPQRFVRPKSPVPLNESKCNKRDSLDDSSKDNHYEDPDTEEENIYAEIPADNIYETVDEMKKTLATMGESKA